MKEIPLKGGRVALVDDDDYQRVMAIGPWYAQKEKSTFYARLTLTHKRKRVTVRMHRFILGITDPQALTDHRDGDGLNNQKYNIRRATPGQNKANGTKRAPATSRFKGVTWVKRYSLWRVNCASKFVGLFKDEIEAAKAYDIAAQTKFGEFAKLNFPSEVAK